MNNRGFIKTLEAVIAIMIVLIFIFTLSKRIGGGEEVDIEAVRSLMDGVLKGVSDDERMRECIIKEVDVPSTYSDYGGVGGNCGNNLINKYVKDNLPQRFDYVLLICNAGVVCQIPPNLPEGTVFTSAALISSSVDAGLYEPRTIRLWMWASR